MKLSLGISVLCIALLFSACRKDTSGNQVRLVKDIVIANNGCTINFNYDDQNRLTSVTQCDTVETYSYSNDTVIYSKKMAGVLIFRNIYKIGKNGLASGFTRLGGDGSLASYLCNYNEKGYLLAVIDTTHPNTTDNFTVNNGDVILEVSSSTVSGDGNYSITSIYYNSTRNTLSNDNFGLSFLGKSSANFKKADSYDNQQGQYTVTYTYILDNQNGVSQQISKINGVVTEVRNYDYY